MAHTLGSLVLTRETWDEFPVLAVAWPNTGPCGHQGVDSWVGDLSASMCLWRIKQIKPKKGQLVHSGKKCLQNEKAQDSIPSSHVSLVLGSVPETSAKVLRKEYGSAALAGHCLAGHHSLVCFVNILQPVCDPQTATLGVHLMPLLGSGF